MQLYFIAIIPPKPLYAYAQRLKEHFAETYNSKAALRSPPHITLHMPFRYKAEKEGKIIEALEQLSSRMSTFTIQVDGFGAFEPRVIYLEVVRGEELVQLQRSLGEVMKKTLNIHNVNYKDQVFHPHLTVAFRDLRKPRFYEAWETFKAKPYRKEFTNSQFSLLKHNGKQWQDFMQFILKGPGT